MSLRAGGGGGGGVAVHKSRAQPPRPLQDLCPIAAT